MTSVFIYKEKKSFIKCVLSNLNIFGCLGLSFYFNYKFIDGNNFFDVIIFVFFLVILSSKLTIEYKKHYHDVSDEKIEKIKNILKND